MSSSSTKVIVVQNDRRAADAVRLGFEREGVTVVVTEPVDDGGKAAAALVDSDTVLVVAGAEGRDAAKTLLSTLSKACRDGGSDGPDAPLLWVGNGVARREAWAAGADEVLEQPAYLRDVVTVGKLLAGRRFGQRSQVTGDLGDYFGVFYLVRALAATGRSGVLTLVRGLRRGEVRFYEGELTSAHMGGLHGQAGFHQLLLWTEARFEWRHEQVVQRRQIPLPHVEVLAQAERFLGDIREVAGGLSPAAVYEQDVQQIQAMAKQLPTEVYGVLRLFDGNRTVADVVEDSPFRVFETLRVGQRAAEVGLLRRVETQKRGGRRAVLAVEEWLVGSEPKEAVIDRAMALPDTAPSPKLAESQVQGGGQGQGKKKNKHRKKHRQSGPAKVIPGVPVVAQAAPVVDWAALVPRATSVDMSAITGVVPSASASGEIEIGVHGGALHARIEGREGLEALTDPDTRSQMFPGSEPSVAVDLPVADLAAATAAIVAVARELERAPTPPIVASPEPEPEPAPPPPAPPPPPTPPEISAEIAATRVDVVAATAHAAPSFSEDEEAFFQAGRAIEHHRTPAHDSFADLDEGYQPQSFWDRLRGPRTR
jgi:hypothetical protein